MWIVALKSSGQFPSLCELAVNHKFVSGRYHHQSKPTSKPRYQNFTNNFPTHISLCNRPSECCHHKILPLSFIIQSFRHSGHFSLRSNDSAQVYSNWPRRDLFIFVANKHEIPSERGLGKIPDIRGRPLLASLFSIQCCSTESHLQ